MINLNNADVNLLLIDYPTGGYGYYLTRLINSFVTNVVKTPDSFLFDQSGSSHSLPLVAGDIHFEKQKDLFDINPIYYNDIFQKKYILIPYCPGIHNDSMTNAIETFTDAKIIRLYYKDNTWPLVFQNCIFKALKGNMETNVEFDKNMFGSSSDWAKRENFTLFFTNHHYRAMWKEFQHPRVLNVDIFDLLTIPGLILQQIADFISGTVTQFELLSSKHQQFLNSNPNTVTHLEILKIVNCLTVDQDLQHIKELYHQAAMNFYIQLKFNFVIPSNDYSKWFTNTNKIVKMLDKHGVIIDPH